MRCSEIHNVARRRTSVVPFIINLSIATCLSGFSRQPAKWGQLRENCFTCLEDFVYSAWKSGWRLLNYIDHQFSRPLQCTSRLSSLSLFNLHFTIPLLTDIHVSIYISSVTFTPLSSFFYSLSLFDFLPRFRKKRFIRSSYSSKYNYVLFEHQYEFWLNGYVFSHRLENEK